MSIPVTPVELGRELGDWGAGALITVTPDGRPRVVTVRPALVDLQPAPQAMSADVHDASTDGGPFPTLRFVRTGRSAVDNIRRCGVATVFFAPTNDGDGHSLIVDGDATVVVDVDGDEAIELNPTSAVRHRPAPTLND